MFTRPRGPQGHEVDPNGSVALSRPSHPAPRCVCSPPRAGCSCSCYVPPACNRVYAAGYEQEREEVGTYLLAGGGGFSLGWDSSSFSGSSVHRSEQVGVGMYLARHSLAYRLRPTARRPCCCHCPLSPCGCLLPPLLLPPLLPLLPPPRRVCCRCRSRSSHCRWPLLPVTASLELPTPKSNLPPPNALVPFFRDTQFAPVTAHCPFPAQTLPRHHISPSLLPSHPPTLGQPFQPCRLPPRA